MDEFFTVWIAKYAIAKGIIQAEVLRRPSREYVYNSDYVGPLELGKDAFLTEDEAKVAANQLRLRRIESFKRKIAKLEKMTF